MSHHRVAAGVAALMLLAGLPLASPAAADPLRLPCGIVDPCLATAGASAPIPAAPPAPAATAASFGCRHAGARPTSRNARVIRRALLCLLNGQRAAHGLGRLRSSSALRSAAARFAHLMVREHFFDHTSPAGSTPLKRIAGTSYLRRASSYSLAENIGWGSGSLATPAAMVGAWMASAGHRENILDPAFHDLGVGVAIGAPARGAGGRAATFVTDFGARS
jgi:uncharacterized protein YkwD